MLRAQQMLVYWVEDMFNAHVRNEYNRRAAGKPNPEQDVVEMMPVSENLVSLVNVRIRKPPQIDFNANLLPPYSRNKESWIRNSSPMLPAFDTIHGKVFMITKLMVWRNIRRQSLESIFVTMQLGGLRTTILQCTRSSCMCA